MEKLPRQAVSNRPVVDVVTDQGVTDRLHVDANLMGPTGFQLDLEQAFPPQGLDHLEMRHRLARRCPVNSHPMALARSAANRCVDRPGSRTEPSVGQCRVNARNLPVPDHPLQIGVGLLLAGDDHQSAGAPVKAVHDSRPLGVIAPGKRADFTVFSKDIMTIPAEEILKVEPVMTVVDGEIVYEASTE